ncbi:hypothetical protein O181_025768 [Austropuccinia psidii MF-1]|uniref:Tf2-1-like SH3-like domain-containing protein n=1 Tax=Austropuccinia psidii MF-1 TaxID=1389203 RepID=A0A9Q3GZF3_9BASI|nr:hypothetical protein [Austropuccinia psidii MF-1]
MGEICIAEAKEYNKQRYEKIHKEPNFREFNQDLLSTLNFNILNGPKKMRDSFLGPFTITRLIGKNAVEFRLIEEISRKHPLFQVSLVKPYQNTGEDKFSSRNNSHTQHKIVEVEGSTVPLKKIRLNGKDHRQYLVIFKNRTAEKEEWLAEDSIPDGYLHMRRLRASSRAGKSHK